MLLVCYLGVMQAQWSAAAGVGWNPTDSTTASIKPKGRVNMWRSN